MGNQSMNAGLLNKKGHPKTGFECQNKSVFLSFNNNLKAKGIAAFKYIWNVYFQLQVPMHAHLYYVGSQANIGAKVLSMGDWEKANRMSCCQALTRTVCPNPGGVITGKGISSYWQKIFISTQFCRSPPDARPWSYALLGEEAGLAKVTISCIYPVLPWSYL